MGLVKIAPSSLPSSPEGFVRGDHGRLSISLSKQSYEAIYVLFVVDDDTATGKPWCPDVRAALPVVQGFLSRPEHADLEVLVVSVGSRAAWRDPSNVWRAKWGVRAVPTLVKYTLAAGDGAGHVAQAQLVEEDVARGEKLAAFFKGA